MKRAGEWQQLKAQGKSSFALALPGAAKLELYFDSVLCESIYCRDFEAEELDFLRAYLRQGDVFFDVGANIGLFSVVAGGCVGKAGAIHAFEPVAKTFDRLMRNVGINDLGNVTCHRVALSDEDSTLSMNVYVDGFDAWSTLASPSGAKRFKSESVRAVRLDRLMEELGIPRRVTMMKVDVEGWELRALRGAGELLSRPDAPVLMVEFTQQYASAAGSTCQDVYRLLEQLGYRMYLYDRKRRALVHDPIRGNYPYLNLIAAKDVESVCSRIGGGA